MHPNQTYQTWQATRAAADDASARDGLTVNQGYRALETCWVKADRLNPRDTWTTQQVGRFVMAVSAFLTTYGYLHPSQGLSLGYTHDDAGKTVHLLIQGNQVIVRGTLAEVKAAVCARLPTSYNPL